MNNEIHIDYWNIDYVDVFDDINRPPVVKAIIKKTDKHNDKTSTLFKQTC